jgi:hypothetical protein
MKTTRWKWQAGSLALAAAAALCGSAAVADDGAFDADGGPVLKSMSQEGNYTGPIKEAEHAFIGMMKFYTKAQSASGVVAPIDYYNADGVIQKAGVEYAKPLIGVYMYGPVETVEGLGFVGHGKRDAFAAVSLDDGLTWKSTNLSESAEESSSDVVRPDIPLFEPTGAYPGDVINMFHTVAGNRVLVAWPSRYCEGGEPNYSLDNPEASDAQKARRAAIATYLGIDLATASPDDLYLIDMYGVAGQQGSVDYAEDKFEQNHPVGRVPFACLWTARGVLVKGDDPRTKEQVEYSYMRWFKAERLTSGRRDVNRVETVCVAGAGCAITWQEDPEGLRPGQGEGPGEGWSGAIANSGTDVWYSYIPWSSFDVVQNPADLTGATPMTFADYTTAAAASDITQKPQPFVPLAMPMRLTDNEKCNPTNPSPYCNGTAIQASFPDLPKPQDYGLRNMCAKLAQVPTGKEGTLSDVCVTESGLPLIGNTAATRPRLGLYGYDSTGAVNEPEEASIDSAFAVVILEEDKGLGRLTVKLADGSTTYVSCNPDEATPDEPCEAFDEGKNIWYHTFSMSLTDKLAAHPLDGLPKNLGSHGNILNQPQVDWTTGNFYPQISTSFLWGTDFPYNYNLYNTEIARRGSLLAQDVYKVHAKTSTSKIGLVALPAWKQGVMNQGGPADVMVRRIVLPNKGKWDLAKNGNPYAFRNMQCKQWAYKDGSNPYYPEGVCLDSAINLSATIPDVCKVSDDAGNAGDPLLCPQVDFSTGTPFGIGNTNPILEGSTVEQPNKTKVLAWHQCPASFTNISATTGTTVYNCDNDLRTDASTLVDQSWYNPLDVAKGHRGFLDGDFVMMLYAWSPNWKLNAKGADRYELYIRRSFDGAQSWTTLPKNFTTWDKLKYDGFGTTTCETFRSDQVNTEGQVDEPRVCNDYVAGAPEQARNVTQHKSMRITTLDPRYAITGSPTGTSVTADPFATGYIGNMDDDMREPSRFFVVYETGDNTTAAEGEPEPLDLFYSRAINWGDQYVVWAEEDGLEECYPSDPHFDVDNVPTELVGTGFCNEFDQMERGIQGLEASEASLVGSPGGQFLYGVWAELEIDDLGNLIGSDAQARRVWWIDDFIPLNAWIFGQGDGQTATTATSVKKTKK